MVTICLQCGDVGFDAYVYCVKCVKVAVHRYCLPEVPKTFDEVVRWVCDDCEALSSWYVGQKVRLTADDGTYVERVVATSTTYSNEISISQSSQGGAENYCRTGLMLQSVDEDLGCSGDVRLADDCCLSGGEPNANNDYLKANVPMEHEPQSNSSRSEEVKVAADESLQRTRGRGKTESFSSLSAKEKQRLNAASNQKKYDCERQSDTSFRLLAEEEAEAEHDHQTTTSRQLDGLVEEAKSAADESQERTRPRKRTKVSSSLSGDEKPRLPTTSNEKRFDGQCQSDTSRHSREDEAEVAADELSKRTKFSARHSGEEAYKLSQTTKYRDNSDISTAVPEKEKQKQTTSNDCPIAYEKKVDYNSPSRFYSLPNERQRSNSARTHVVEEVTEVVTEGSTPRGKLEVKRHISTSVRGEDKQMTQRRSTSPNQFRSRQQKQHGDRAWRYAPSSDERRKDRSAPSSDEHRKDRNAPSSDEHRKDRNAPSSNERRKDRTRSLSNSPGERYSGPSSRETPNSRRPLQNIVRENERKHVIEKTLATPTRSKVNEEVSIETHEARIPMHHAVSERYKDRLKEESSVMRNIKNGNEEGSQLTHEARRPMYDTERGKVKEQMKERSFDIPAQSNVHNEAFEQKHEARRPTHYTGRERYKGRVKEEESIILTRSNCDEEVSRDTIITQPIQVQPIQVQPVVDPIWKGKFNIVNKNDDIFEVFVAHVSSRACPQAIDEARLLPVSLQLEMVPKSTVWPKSFQTTEPSDDHIALYFFPADRRYEKVFDRLVSDMSDHDLAMKAITKNAELLIFTSIELPMKFWRFQNKYFIWGVFRGKGSTSSDAKANLGELVNRAARH